MYKLQYTKIKPEMENQLWDIFWADQGMPPEFLSNLNCTQKINHF
jgi:hypothetical protein